MSAKKTVTKLLIDSLRIYNEESANFNELLNVLDKLAFKLSNNFRFVLDKNNSEELKKIHNFIKCNEKINQHRPLAILNLDNPDNIIIEGKSINYKKVENVIAFYFADNKITISSLHDKNRTTQITTLLEQLDYDNN